MTGVVPMIRRRRSHPACLRQVASTGDTSTNWNGAAYRLEVGTVVPGQSLPSSSLLAYGTINEVGGRRVLCIQVYE